MSTSAGDYCRVRGGILSALFTAGVLSIGLNAAAADFADLAYDAQTDKIVAKIVYRGTNPDHTFRVEWDECQPRDDGGHEVAGRVIDNQWDDEAAQEYRSTVRLSLTDLPCRPVRATLFIEPNFRGTIDIPAPPA